MMLPSPQHCRHSPVADPAPLGLAAFALTTFLLSAVNAGWAKSSTGFDWWSYAIAYGGLCQLLAGMWEFRNRNVFGATAFSTYGGFWIGLGLWLHFIVPTVKLTAIVSVNRDLGWILLAFAIFNTYMLIISTQVNLAVFLVFLTLEITEIFLFIGNLTTKVPVLPPDINIGGAVTDRRLHRRGDRAGGLVHLGGRRHERGEGQGGLPGRQAAVQPLTSRLGANSSLGPGGRQAPGTFRCKPSIP